MTGIHVGPFASRASSLEIPATIDNLLRWHRSTDLLFQDAAATTPADEADDPIGKWRNKVSPGTGDLTQSTAGARPLLKLAQVNALPAIEFDAVDDMFDWPSLNSLTAGEIFIILAIDVDPPTAAKSALWRMGTTAGATHYPFEDANIYDEFGTNSRKDTTAPAADLTAFHLYNVRSAADAWSSHINGTQHFATATNTVSFNATPKIGNAGSPAATTFLDGRIAEILLYSRVLETAERAAIMNYLDTRYGL